MVLDGVLDPAVSLDERNRLQALGFEQNLTAFLADCARRTSCLFHHEGHSREAFDRLFQQIDRVSIPVGARSVGPAEFTAAVFSQLYNSSRGWPRLEKLLNEAEHGNGSPALARYDAYVDRHPDGTYDNTNEANLAVNCSDLAASNDPKHLEDEAATLAQQAPTFGPAAVWYMAPCTFWPVAPTPVPVGPAHGAPTILLVGNTSDPATPYVWAQQVAARLADSVLLTYNHTGHTAYNGGSTCIRTRVDSYLLAQQAPPPGTVCN